MRSTSVAQAWACADFFHCSPSGAWQRMQVSAPRKWSGAFLVLSASAVAAAVSFSLRASMALKPSSNSRTRSATSFFSPVSGPRMNISFEPFTTLFRGPSVRIVRPRYWPCSPP